MVKSKTVLVCPLDWGLGHATRMVPVIDCLVRRGARVILAADHGPYNYLSQRFPDLHLVRLSGFEPKYPKRGSMGLAMIRSYPSMQKAASVSRSALEGIIKKYGVDVVISDNRYELYSEKAYSVIVTHQLHIHTSGWSSLFSPFIHQKIHGFIRRFDELWIPDFQGYPNLAGKLSHPKKMPVKHYRYIGPLSRFSLVEATAADEKPELLFLLSGPEPQRSILEGLLRRQAHDLGLQTIILQGLPGKSEVKDDKNIRLYPHLPDEQFAGLVKNAGTIVCRPGYSTLMDLTILDKKAILIPTPGQTEQEYLSDLVSQKGWFYAQKQKSFDLREAIEKTQGYGGMTVQVDRQMLEESVDTVLAQ
jgi:uncharacterized protein (TIGR00661 family)